MGLNPTGSEIPRSLTEIGTTIDVALDSKADFVRVTDNPSTATAASSYAITGTLEFDGTPITGPASLDFVSTNLWQGDSSSLSIESGKWRLIFGGPSVQGSWLSVQTTATRPENCTWIEEENVSGTPILAFTRATVATTGQFALADDGVYDPVMWQNIGDDVTPDWVPLATATALSAHTTATGNVHGLSAAQVRSILGVSTLSGSNTGDQNLSSYATTSAVAAGYVPRITSVDNRLTRFDGTTGAVQSSGITVDDSDNVTGVNDLYTEAVIASYGFLGGDASGVYLRQDALRLGPNHHVGWTASLAPQSYTPDSRISRQSAGVLQIGTTANNASGSLALTNLTASGTTTTVGLNVNLASGGFVDINRTSQAGVRESILRARVSDSGNDAFHIFNATVNDGGFAPGFSGSRVTSNSIAMVFAANTTAANDNGTTVLMVFDARLTDSQTDPNNGTLSSVVTRPLFSWVSFSTEYMRMFANGNLAIGSTTDNGAKLQVAGNLTASGTVAIGASAKFTEQTYTPTGTTQTIDLNSGNLNTLSLGSTTGNVTLTLTVPTSAASGRIKIIQHGTTARGITIALSAGTAVWYSAIPAFSSQAISKKTMLSYTWDGTDMSFQAAEAI
jgi:hypothetical protein